MKSRSKMKSLSSEHFPKYMRPIRVGNYHADIQNWTKIKLVPDVMPVLIICMFDEDPIKSEIAIVRTLFPPPPPPPPHTHTHPTPIVCLWESKRQVTQMHIATSIFATCSVSLQGQTRDKFNRFLFPCWCAPWSFPTGMQQGLLSLLVCNRVFFPCWCFTDFLLLLCHGIKQNDQNCGIMKLYDLVFLEEIICVEDQSTKWGEVERGQFT